MKSVSNTSHSPINTTQLLSALLKQTYTQHSLQHCFPPSKIIDQMTLNKKSKLNGRLKEIEMNDQQEIMEGYFINGLSEIAELTEYYKYYTQSSLLYQQSFFHIMHNHREQQKAYHYHKFKALLDFSGSTQQPSTSEADREQGQPQSSFLLLQQLSMSGNNQESLLIEKLKNKLQKGFGPNRYHTLQEIDKQYIFSKKIAVMPSSAKKNQNKNDHKNTQKNIKEATQRTNSIQKKMQKKRNNTCDSELYTSYKTETQTKLRRKKNGSMASLFSLDKSFPLTRESSLKATRTVFKPTDNIENQVKSKILGLKQKIRQQKEQLLRKAEMVRPKKQQQKVCRRQRH